MRRRILTFFIIFSLVFGASLALANIAYTQVNTSIERPKILIYAAEFPTQQPKKNDQEEQPGQKDQSTSPEEPTSSTKDFPDNEIGNLLNQHLKLMVNIGTDAEQKYQESLRKLQQKAPEVASVAFNSYLKIDESRYFRRWAITQTLKELRSDSTLVALKQIALADIPMEKFSDPENFSVDKEVNIRVNAVDGIAELAKQGNLDAEGILTQLIAHSNLTLRRRAIRGYLAVVQKKPNDYQTRETFLRSKLSESDRKLINLDVTNIKLVPHPDDVPDNLYAPKKQQDDAAPVIKYYAQDYAQSLLQALQAINIDYSVTKSQILSWLSNEFSQYPQFAEGCLQLLGGKRLKKNVYLDVIFWNYRELGGKITSNSRDGILDTEILKKAMLEGYIPRNGGNLLSFEDIVELKY